jgi:hypothetical protein
MKKCNVANTIMYSLLIVIVGLLLWTFTKNKSQLSPNPSRSESKQVQLEKFVNPLYNIRQGLKNYSNYNKVVLKGQCKQDYYSNDILTEDQKKLIQNVVKYILQDVSNISSENNDNFNINNNGIYNFKEINRVLVETNLMGKRYIVDTFVYDIKHFHSVRIMLDFVIIGDDVYLNNVQLYDGANNNLMNRFDSISGAGVGILYSTDQFQENWVTMMNNSYAKYKLFGVDGSTLESSDLDPVNNNLHKLDINSHGKLILPTYIDNDKTVKPLSPEFCKAQEVDWDQTGANKPRNVPPNCALHNSATIAQANVPYYTPSIFDQTQTYNNKEMNDGWMFTRNRDPMVNGLTI